MILRVRTNGGYLEDFDVPPSLVRYVKVLESQVKYGFDVEKYNENTKVFFEGFDDKDLADSEDDDLVIFAENKSEKYLTNRKASGKMLSRSEKKNDRRALKGKLCVNQILQFY